MAIHPLEYLNITSIEFDGRVVGLPYPVSASHPLFDPDRQWIDMFGALRSFTEREKLEDAVHALSDIVSPGVSWSNPKLVRALASTFVNWPKPGNEYGGLQFGFKESVKVSFELRDSEDPNEKEAAYEMVSREIPYLYMSGVNDEGRCVFWGQMPCPATVESVLENGLRIAVDRYYSVGVFTISHVPQAR